MELLLTGRPRVGLQPRAVDHAGIAEGLGIDDRRVAGDHVGGETARPPDPIAEAMAAEARRKENPGSASTAEITGMASGVMSIMPAQLSAI